MSDLEGRQRAFTKLYGVFYIHQQNTAWKTAITAQTWALDSMAKAKPLNLFAFKMLDLDLITSDKHITDREKQIR